MRARLHTHLVLLSLLAAACGGDSGPRPNVVLITMDTTRADYLSCYGFEGIDGQRMISSPNLDRLAAQGTRFDLAMSTAAVTPVSHASILTGRFNAEHGVRVIFAGSGFRLDESVPTLGTEFKRAGYTTLALHSAFPVSPYFGLDQGFDLVDSFDTEMKQRDPAATAQWDQRNTRRSDDTIARVIEAVEASEDPFFLWVHLWDPHDAIQIPEPDFMPPPRLLYQTDEQGNFVPETDGDGNVLYELDERGQPVLDPSGNPVPRRKLRRPMKALYASEIWYMDHQIGKLVAHLEESGRYDNTIFAVTADHGQGLGDHGWAAHRILYQEQIRVPLIVRVPGVEQAAVVPDLVRTVDIAPTLLDYAGVGGLDGVSGRSLRRLIEGGDAPRVTFAEQINGYDLNAGMVVKRPQDDFTYCAMDRRWKLTWRPNWPDESELYDLQADPAEASNLYAWDHPEAVRLKRELASYGGWVTAVFPSEDGGADSDAAMEALRNLGYVDEGGGEEALGDIAWEFVCPVHYDERAGAASDCAECGERMILIAAGK